MATELLATGGTVASSIDLVVADGETVTVALKGVTDAFPTVDVELKDDAGGYNRVEVIDMTKNEDPVIVITAPGTYRFTRRAGMCGVFRA